MNKHPARVLPRIVLSVAHHIPLATLTYAADAEVDPSWRNPALADHTRPIITTCILGPVGALGGKLLVDMGFTDVHILDGGVMAWKEAGLPKSGGDRARLARETGEGTSHMVFVRVFHKAIRKLDRLLQRKWDARPL